jgi:hypothetical protein
MWDSTTLAVTALMVAGKIKAASAVMVVGPGEIKP